MNNLIFEWDIDKSSINLKKHKVSFEEAMSVWNDDYAAMFYDEKHSDFEERYYFVGYSKKNNLLVISFTERDNKIRIISARKATKYERNRHEENRFKY
jgi:uncharacterized DUF497 family protein